MIASMPDLGPAVSTVVRRCLDIKEGEVVLVVCDPRTMRIAEEFRGAAHDLGADAVLALMDEREIDGNEPPRTIAGALNSCDVYIAPTTRSLSHTVARKRASDAGGRGATMPGVTEDMLARVMAIDFDAMAARCAAVAGLLDGGDEAHLTCPRGSDLRLDLRDRRATADDGRLTDPGAFGNLPCGEGFIAPLSGQGTLVASSLASLGLAEEPARLTVDDGHIVAAEGELGSKFLRRLEAHGQAGTNLAELGVGTNDRAQLTGKVLEDEKILGTVHIAFGASAGIGGTVSVPIHLDAVVLDATLTVDARPVLDQGRYVLDGAG